METEYKYSYGDAVFYSDPNKGTESGLYGVIDRWEEDEVITYLLSNGSYNLEAIESELTPVLSAGSDVYKP